MAADIKAAADEALEVRRETDHFIQEWMDSIGEGVPGYVTPKVAVGAVVGNDEGEILLVQRADSGVWLYPTGWADIGYSPAEVAVKEVEEETGIHCEPVRVLGRDRRHAPRLHPLRDVHGACSTARPSAAQLQPHPLETADVGWFAEDDLPWPHRRASTGGARRPSPPSEASRSRPCSTRPAARSGAARAEAPIGSRDPTVAASEGQRAPTAQQPSE